LIRALEILHAGAWQASAAAEVVTLDFDHRFRRRLRFTTGQGTEILLDLPQAVHIRGGDALLLEDGRAVGVRAAEESLLEVTAENADMLARLAWHLGNRHLSVQFSPGRLRILDDHVIAEMVTQLGGSVRKIAAPFDPESGAYHHG
jgi:urease accessory protein